MQSITPRSESVNTRADYGVDAPGMVKGFFATTAGAGLAAAALLTWTSPYVEVFRQSGLTVTGPNRAERIAYGIAGYLVATKPTP